MCGIFGILNKKTDRALAERCLNRLVHRGPDGFGLWQEGGVTLGHRRLAIFDLSDQGTQPMPDASGRYRLVYNGEIYNFPELRHELEALGYHFRSNTDSEVLLYSLLEWKEKALYRFNGMWAFALYDREKKELFLSRDRFGIKPLFYTEDFSATNGYSFSFASEMKALLPLLDEVKPNKDIVCHPERFVHYENTSDCVFQGIKRFPAGYCARVDERGMRLMRFWNTLDHLTEVPKSYREQTEMFRELFLDSCRLRMRSDVPVGTALSGGLDSSSVLCAMAHIDSLAPTERVSRDWRHAYIASFPGTTLDETEYAKCVTDKLNVPSTIVNIDPSTVLDRLDEMFYLFEEVYITSPIPMMLLYGALRKGGTLVTIDGHGADELFGGYPFDILHAFDDARSTTERELIASTYLGCFPHDDSNNAVKNMSAFRLYLNYQRKKLTRRLRGDHVKPLASSDPAFRSLDHLNRVLYASSHENILPTLLRNYDHYSMANGVEIRMPFMDHRIVSFAFSIGWRSKLHGGYTKSIIRDGMHGLLPEKVERRKTKLGFNTPVVEWMKGPMREYFEDTVSSKDFKTSELIDSRAVKKKVLGVIKDEKATFTQGEQAFSALIPYLWDLSFRRKANE